MKGFFTLTPCAAAARVFVLESGLVTAQTRQWAELGEIQRDDPQNHAAMYAAYMKFQRQVQDLSNQLPAAISHLRYAMAQAFAKAYPEVNRD